MSTKLILLINESDDNSLEEVISVCLNVIARWNVVSASTKTDVNLCLNKSPDAVLFNVQANHFNQLSVAQIRMIQQLKHNLLTRLSPILLMIDTANWFTQDQLRSLGISGAIAKPFDPMMLPAQITQLLDWNN